MDALEQFFKSAVQDLEAASIAVVKSRAASLQKEIKGQLKSNFKGRIGGVSVKYLAPNGQLGPAAYVSVKPKFLSIFEEGGTITGKGYLVIRTPQGKKAGFPRVNKKGLATVLKNIPHRLVQTSKGYAVLVRKTPKSKEILAYFLAREVREDKRLEFFNTANRLAAGMDSEIASFIKD